MAYSIVHVAASGAVLSDAQPLSVEVIATRVEAVTFESKILGCPKTFCAVLPKGYDRSRKDWPVLFLFHGRGRNERSLIDDPVARQAFLDAPFVTIFPDGDDGWYINSPVRKADRYNDYLEEVISVAEKHYGLSKDSKLRGLTGWSMGGYGCVMFAENHPDQFSAVAPIIGLLDFPRDGLPAGQSYKVPVARFGSDQSIWVKFNPINNVGQLKQMSICIITGKTAFDLTMNRNFAARLKESDIEYTWHELPGRHSLSTVRQAVPIVIQFMSEKFKSTGN